MPGIKSVEVMPAPQLFLERTSCAYSSHCDRSFGTFYSFTAASATAEAFGNMVRNQGGEVILQHWLTLLSGLVESLFFTGIAYGWASLVFVLKADGYFAAYCTNATRNEDYAVYTDCSGQDEHFSQVLSVASIATTILRFPIGYVFDRCGTAVTRIVAISLYTTGTLLITLSNAALSSLIIAGMMLYITNVQVGNLFHSYRSTTITIYNGAFESSAAVCLIIKLLYERGVSLHTSFLFLTLCNIIHCVRTIFLMPRRHIPYPLPETFTYGVSCTVQKRKRRREENDTVQTFKEGDAEKTEKDEKATFRSCVFSWLFFCHLVWVVTIILSQFIFLANVNPMLSRLADEDQTVVSHYTNAFAITQLCGVLFAPLSGLLMDRHKHRPLAPGETSREADLRSAPLALFLSCLLCFFFCVCFTCPVLPLQYVTFILQVFSSSFFYGLHQAFISIAFPASHFGKMSGMAMSLSALVLLLQFPLLHLIQNQLRGDPLYVNIGITVVSLLAFIHPVQVSLYCRELAKQRQISQLTQLTSLRSSDHEAVPLSSLRGKDEAGTSNHLQLGVCLT
ncbi:equilibrative nucleobase transporter 1-like isoform X2 [Platichthys flesus]|uniref:equilibrative nucleobase transporter 1-like isoform X2 n=1 Tax=Platichthys flesus TaxID=8260 RepID=UPI002DB58975|nr:equilibrative nucleobase transporter 1-like isoform X2 [Platichthys flesus]